jgi:hypothetical protein
MFINCLQLCPDQRIEQSIGTVCKDLQNDLKNKKYNTKKKNSTKIKFS